MRRIFLAVTFIFTLMTATAFAAENDYYEYTSEVFGFKIVCPSKPAVVVNPFEDPKQHGELLVFANDGMKIIYGFQIMIDAFDTKKVPDFNKDKKKVIDAYIEKKRNENIYNFVELQNISPNNKGVVMVTSTEITLTDENGEETTAVADQQTAYALFRSRSGRCISIQLISADLDETDYQDFLKSVSTYRDATDLSMPPEDDDKKSKKKK